MNISFKNIATVLLVFLAVLSCEKAIKVDIRNSPSKYVIQGIINDDSTCTVRISQTSNFYDTLNFNGVSNARVTITDNSKSPIPLRETSDRGVYRANLLGISGHTYLLNVQVDGSTFTASSTMPQKVKLDSLYVTERLFLGQNRIFATVRFRDPLQEGNAYRFVQYVNGERETNVFVLNDVLFNNRVVLNDLLIYDDEYTLRKCDQLRVDMQCIDQPGYLYWYSLNQSALGTSQSASPANPATNIQGGALGYFSAYTVSSFNIAVLPDSTCSYPSN